MTIKDTPQYKQLKEAMDSIRNLKVPEHLQQKALEHLLLGFSSDAHEEHPPARAIESTTGSTIASTKDLREYIKKINPKGGVAEIPALLYWMKTREKKSIANEGDILTLYRRADIRPPKNIAQSIRDLASKKKYGRLEAVKDEPGYVRLSQVGEDFVLYDLQSNTNS